MKTLVGGINDYRICDYQWRKLTPAAPRDVVAHAMV
jgi:hypothetical protein